ncbi:MAG: two-component system phosphate regulon sensor histidine kinase PhoR [Flavobacteriaceae bacterium]|jgi:two-component system phosphate regulon sensor histidine kinase PhoR
MSFKFKKSYSFAFKSSIAISLIITFIVSLFYYSNFLLEDLLIELICLSVLIFLTSFFIIQSRIETFIYLKIKNLYKELNLLDSISLSKSNVTTDMNSLMKNINEFSRDKKLEIETLKIREEFRKEFIGNVAHELKTPIFTIQGYIENLIDGAITDEDVRDKFLNRAKISVERLIYIIKDLDMITKFESGTLNLELDAFDINELVQDVYEQLEIQAQKKEIKLIFNKNYPESIFVNGDKDKIEQVVTNLVINSIKYGTDKGTTEVSFESLTNDKLIVRITDNGDGILKEHLSRLFERFYRVDQSGSRKEGGSGLGLSIVKHIIDAHNENIYIESELGIGSEFSFTLSKYIN